MKNSWRKLDNAAKIFPSAASKSDTQVFRFSCELKAAVNPDLLQKAVEDALSTFKIYQCTLRRGFFWYYLEDCDILPVVHEENKPLCSQLYFRGIKSLLFDVSYFGSRINLDIYHVLCDGTGATEFFKLILSKYLSKANSLPEYPLDYDASLSQMSDDSFNKYYSHAPAKNVPACKNVCTLHGTRESDDRLNAISGSMNVRAVLDNAHKYNTSLTSFLCACLMQSINQTLPVRAKKRPVVIGIPVNLRKRFESASARNFFSLIFSEYNFSTAPENFESIIQKINSDLKAGLDKDNLSNIINGYTATEHNIFVRLTPLPIKNLVLKIAHERSNNNMTAVISNIGQIDMPEPLRKYIDNFYVYASTNALQICACSFGDKLTVNFTSPFSDTEIQRHFFRCLSSLGIDIEISTNMLEN